jgi:membrane-bound inhibitor of C-type lysozyme
MRTAAGKRMTGRIAASLGAALLAVLAGSAAHAEKARYRCIDGSSIAATFKNGAGGSGSVLLAFGGKTGTITLPQVPSADGGRYADDTIEFWIKGRGATLTRAGKATTCNTRG